MEKVGPQVKRIRLSSILAHPEFLLIVFLIGIIIASALYNFCAD